MAKPPLGSAVNPWHAVWQAAALRVQTEAAARGDFARIPDIGQAAMARTPGHLRTGAMDALYEAYWNYRADWDIRRLLEEDDDLGGIGTEAMFEAVREARKAGESTVTVSRDHLALLLENFDQMRLRQHHRQDRGDQ